MIDEFAIQWFLSGAVTGILIGIFMGVIMMIWYLDYKHNIKIVYHKGFGVGIIEEDLKEDKL